MKLFKILAILPIAIIIVSCNHNAKKNESPEIKGKLFIIGGGFKPNTLIEKMLEVSNLQPDDYAVVLPMASSVPDTAAYYGIKIVHATVTLINNQF